MDRLRSPPAVARFSMHRWPRALGGLVLAAALAGCATQPQRPELTPAQRAAAEAAQAGRERQLREQRDWSLSGRIAVSSQGRGGSGRIEWRQAGPHYRVSLSAPITRQSWRLSGDAHGAVLEGLEGGPRRGADARTLLLRATGWDIPVVALAEWVRGARAQALGPARIEYRADGLPWLIEQGGWRIEYEWPEPAEPSGAGSPAASPFPPLPERLEAEALGHDAGVKLIVDEWGVAGPAGGP